MFRQSPRMMTDMRSGNSEYIPYAQRSVSELAKSEPSSNVMLHNKNFLSSNILLNRIMEKRNISHAPIGLNTRNFYSNLDLMTIKWAASLNRSE